jgi:hypothetical protein
MNAVNPIVRRTVRQVAGRSAIFVTTAPRDGEQSLQLVCFLSSKPKWRRKPKAQGSKRR